MHEVTRRNIEAQRVFNAMSERQWNVFAREYDEAMKADTEEKRAFALKLAEQQYRKVQRDLNDSGTIKESKRNQRAEAAMTPQERKDFERKFEQMTLSAQEEILFRLWAELISLNPATARTLFGTLSTSLQDRILDALEHVVNEGAPMPTEGATASVVADDDARLDEDVYGELRTLFDDGGNE